MTEDEQPAGSFREPSDLPELPATPQTTLYNARFLSTAIEKFGREGAWLLISLHHYGWRAHRDVAALLWDSAPPAGLSAEACSHHLEHRAMAALEELFLLLDQCWRTASGILSHRAGDGFLAGYRRYGGNLDNEFKRLQELSEDDWRELLTLPKDEELADLLKRTYEIDDVGQIAEMRERVRDAVQTALVNIGEVRQLFLQVEDAAGLTAHSVRELNNCYRHGTQIVYDDCAPEVIPWRAANPEQGAGLLIGLDELDERASAHEVVHVLLEGPDAEGHARLGVVPRGSDWEQSLMQSMEHLSVLLYKLAHGLLCGEDTGEAVLGAALFSWDSLNDR